VEYFYIPLRMMCGVKANPYLNLKRTVLDDWPWANPTYTLEIDAPKSSITAMLIDASRLMADVNYEDNVYESSPNPSEGGE
jgi:hypothetical protein